MKRVGFYILSVIERWVMSDGGKLGELWIEGK